MAIYGDFEYHAFSDIIKVLQRHTGVLFMRTALAGRSVEMHLREGMLGAMFIDGFPVSEPLRVQDTVRSLVSSASGEYSFEAGQAAQQMNLPINDLIREAVSTASIPEQQLPHQETRFEWQAGASTAQLPSSLRASWDAAGPMLRTGASAVDLSSQLRISLHEARIVLYRLRAANLITPTRAAGAFQVSEPAPAAPAYGQAAYGQTGGVQLHNPAQPQAAAPAPEPANPLRRMLNALRRLTGGKA